LSTFNLELLETREPAHISSVQPWICL